MVSEQLHYTTNREEIFIFSNKKMSYLCGVWRFANAKLIINICKEGIFVEEKSMQNNTGSKGVHKVYLNARKSAVMSGVKDVLSFDAKEVYLETNQGVLLIKGDELHVNRLSLEKGEVDVDGRIDSFAYSDVEDNTKKAATFFGRLFQ